MKMAVELSDFIEAAGLLEYDPQAITEIYKGHPYRLFIWSKGKEIEVGKMLTNKEKIEFSKILVKSIKKV